MRTVRITAKTVEAAVEQGLKQLGITKSEATIEVIAEPSSSLFGLIHKKDAIVEISAPDIEEEKEEAVETVEAMPAEAPVEVAAEETAEEPAEEKISEGPKTEETVEGKEEKKEFVFDPEEQLQTANEAKEFLQNVFKGMHLDVQMERMINEERILINLRGEGLGILIGKHGQTLDALQYLTNLAAGKQFKNRYFVLLDVENYRERRKDTLEALAKRLAGKVKRTGEPVKLEPMPAGERRIIHLALQNDPAVTTESEGDVPYRYVVIARKQ